MTQALSKLNFRDLGGLRTADGGIVRPGIIYRSEGPASFGPVHHEELAALNIKLVCDLRSEGEREKDPNGWAASARLLNLDVTADLRVKTNNGWEALREDQSSETIRSALVGNYAAIPAALRPHLKHLVESIVNGETPMLVHCTAGKDRTGVMVALLLSAIGVPDDVVIADYERSDVFAKNMRLRGGIEEQFMEAFGFIPTQDLIDAMIGVDVAFLEAAFEMIKSEYGDLDSYFAAAGVDTTLLARFRETMVSDG
ncbi:tyrosine-protein phosphatase [Novosphingobium sp. CCH12-A3]|uniref:tyrosine-protein phosphatase n=1 Tax=Novosphingobium sp. CCH12-A3 TaxID=1768752 RepID=UPI0007805726|nr:tyrosine-protein phosphatase [Novosphingobium sp. CCH12-A3]